MPTAKRVRVQLSRRHTWNLKGGYSIAPERYVPGGGEQLPGWVAVCTAASCSCSRGRPPHSFAPANHKCGNICPQTGMCSLSMATPPCGGATVFTKVHSRTTRRFRTSALGCAVPTTWSMERPRVVLGAARRADPSCMITSLSHNNHPRLSFRS